MSLFLLEHFSLIPIFTFATERFITNDSIYLLMIDVTATLEKHGNIVSELSRGSQKLVVAVCDGCDKERDSKFRDYRDLCVQCAQKRTCDKKAAVWTDEMRRAQGVAISASWTDDRKEVQRQSMMGEKNWNYGKPKSPETISKLSDAATGRILSDETKDKMSDVRRGVPKSEEMKSRLSTTKLETHPMRGEHWDLEQRIAFSSGHQNINPDDWDGFVAGIRDHVLPIFQCTQINKWFPGCEGHHLSRSLVVFIPAELHNHIWHNMKSGLGMAEMNALALQFAF